MSNRRIQRLGEEIREEVARIISADVKDPRLGFVTVTRVELTADLRSARVLVGILGEAKERARSLGILRRAAGFVRRELGRRLSVRHTPEVMFHLDTGLDASDRVARLLHDTATSDPGDEPESGEGPPDGSAEPEEE
jgi:ribosome-binding factor A